MKERCTVCKKVAPFYPFGYANKYDTLLEKIRTREELPFIDLPLKDDAFDDLEVLCGPKIPDESKEELKIVLEKYAPNTTVRDSGIRIRG